MTTQPKGRPTPKRPAEPQKRPSQPPTGPQVPPGTEVVEFQDIMDSMGRQVATQASAIAMLEAQLAGYRRRAAAGETHSHEPPTPDEPKVPDDAHPSS